MRCLHAAQSNYADIFSAHSNTDMFFLFDNAVAWLESDFA